MVVFLITNNQCVVMNRIEIHLEMLFVSAALRDWRISNIAIKRRLVILCQKPCFINRTYFIPSHTSSDSS